jgi:hypothetical protein
MRTIFRNLVGAVGLFLFTLAVASTAFIIPTFAQVIAPRSFPPRQFNTQQTHYLRFTFNYNSCPMPAAAAVCSIKVGAVPYNAFLKTVIMDLITVFNPTTSATLGLSTTATGATILGAVNVFTGATTGTAPYVYCGTSCGAGTFAGIGLAVTGNSTAQTGAMGGFDVYVVYTSGANASNGTTGQAIFVIEYIAPNDGTCAPVAVGATAGAC